MWEFALISVHWIYLSLRLWAGNPSSWKNRDWLRFWAHSLAVHQEELRSNHQYWRLFNWSTAWAPAFLEFSLKVSLISVKQKVKDFSLSLGLEFFIRCFKFNILKLGQRYFFSLGSFSSRCIILCFTPYVINVNGGSCMCKIKLDAQLFISLHCSQAWSTQLKNSTSLFKNHCDVTECMFHACALSCFLVCWPAWLSWRSVWLWTETIRSCWSSPRSRYPCRSDTPPASGVTHCAQRRTRGTLQPVRHRSLVRANKPEGGWKINEKWDTRVVSRESLYLDDPPQINNDNHYTNYIK